MGRRRERAASPCRGGIRNDLTKEKKRHERCYPLEMLSEIHKGIHSMAGDSSSTVLCPTIAQAEPPQERGAIETLFDVLFPFSEDDLPPF